MLSTMRRYLVILLLVLLPFQMTWSAVGVYCQHEQGIAAKHVGHHDHQHKQGKQSSKAAGGVDADCNYCHVGSVNLPSASSLLATPTVSLLISLPVLPSLPSAVPHKPERPKWTLIA